MEAVKRHLPKSLATAQGHLDQSRKNQRSTKPKAAPAPAEQQQEAPEPTIPVQEPDNLKTQYVYASVLEYSETNMVHGNLTGRFPHTSSQGNKYVLILYNYDGNAILAEPMKA